MLLLTTALVGGASSLDPWRTPGERFYQTGEGLDGAVPAVVEGDMQVRSTDIPCANCHRRSGWASAEGLVAVPPVTASALFAPVTRGGAEMGTLRTSGPGTRPAYDERSLLRAIREGVDAAGRTLSPTMPRYALGDADAGALIAHLRSLAPGQAAGTTRAVLHLATITTPDVDAGERTAVLDALRAYVRDKNAGTRQETRRRERGPWDMKPHYDGYRTWTLHEWELAGPPESWITQLEALYKAQPVFAVVGGITRSGWATAHEFAERVRVPVILPQTPLPPDEASERGFYTLYFSRGVAVEADALVDRMSRDPASRVVQVARCGTPGHSAAKRVHDRLPPAMRVSVTCVDPTGRLALDSIAAGIPEAATVVLWLDGVDVAGVASVIPASVRAVYLSSTLLGAEHVARVHAIASNTLLLHPFVPPDDFDRHAWRAVSWLRARGISPPAPHAAVNALVAAMLAADALSHPRALDSKEYFIERIEAMAARSPIRSAYPETVFGGRRRVGSAGCFVLQVPASEEHSFRKVGEWFVPRS